MSEHRERGLAGHGGHGGACSRLEPFWHTYCSRGGTGGFSTFHRACWREDKASTARRSSMLDWPRRRSCSGEVRRGAVAANSKFDHGGCRITPPTALEGAGVVARCYARGIALQHCGGRAGRDELAAAMSPEQSEVGEVERECE
jgi:hypothetical protein